MYGNLNEARVQKLQNCLSSRKAPDRCPHGELCRELCTVVYGDRPKLCTQSCISCADYQMNIGMFKSVLVQSMVNFLLYGSLSLRFARACHENQALFGIQNCARLKLVLVAAHCVSIQVSC